MNHRSDCIFCKIVENQIPSPRLHEDDQFIVIRDIRPQAKVHLLVLPKQHVESLDQVFDGAVGTASEQLMGGLFRVATQVARKQGLLPGGFRSVINTGKDGGQTVFHLHLHILGGEILGEAL